MTDKPFLNTRENRERLKALVYTLLNYRLNGHIED